MRWYNVCGFICVIGLMLIGLSACQDDDSPSSPRGQIVDATGDWSFQGVITHNNCVGFFFLPPGTPRDLQLRLQQTGTEVNGTRTGGSFWSLVEGIIVTGENIAGSTLLSIANPILAPPPDFTWPPGATGTDCVLQLGGTAQMTFTSDTTATGFVAAPVYYEAGDCGVWIRPLPCDMTVTGEWTKTAN